MENLLIRFGISFFITFAVLFGCNQPVEEDQKQLINAAAADAVSEEEEREEEKEKTENEVKPKGDY